MMMLYPAISIADAEGEEGTGVDGSVSFTITLSPVSGRPVMVTATTSTGTNDTATSSEDPEAEVEDFDFTQTSEPFTFEPGETSKTFSVVTKEDEVVESDETFTVTLSFPENTPENATISTATATGTIQSDEIPAFEISDGVATEGDSGNVAMTFTVTLSHGATQTETVTYNTIPGTAKEVADFIAPVAGSNTLTFNKDDQSETFTIDIVSNDYFELEETFAVQLSGNSARTALINGGRATGIITDNDAERESTIAVSASSVPVGEGNDVQFTFSAVPELARELPITISLTETGDFLTTESINQTTVNLPANTSATSTHTESFKTKAKNGDFEADSTVTLTITDVNGYQVNSSANSASVVIHDFETPTGISVLAISENITEGPNVTADFLIKSNEVSSSARKINVNIDDGVANFINNSGNSIQTIPANTRSLLLEVPNCSR